MTSRLSWQPGSCLFGGQRKNKKRCQSLSIHHIQAQNILIRNVTNSQCGNKRGSGPNSRVWRIKENLRSVENKSAAALQLGTRYFLSDNKRALSSALDGWPTTKSRTAKHNLLCGSQFPRQKELEPARCASGYFRALLWLQLICGKIPKNYIVINHVVHYQVNTFSIVWRRVLLNKKERTK